MNFVAPAILLGLLAAVLPSLIHRIGRRRAQPVRFAAMQLLLRSERQVHSRKRLREILLLVLRTAVAMCLPFLFARPYSLRTTDLPVITLDSQAAVIVLDDSASMGRKVGMGTLFQLAKDRATELVRHIPSDSEVAFLVTRSGAIPRIGVLEPDRTRVLATLAKADCSSRPADFSAAMQQATAILARSNRAHRRIYVFTDMQATGWEDGAGLAGENLPEVIMDDVSGKAPAHNRAVVNLEVSQAPEAGPSGIAVTAEIASFSPQSAPSLPVSFLVDGKTIARGTIEIPANGRARKRFLHAFPEASGSSHDVAVAIEGDDMSFDDERLVHVELARNLRLLIVNGDPRTVRNEDEAFFLETALRSALPNAFITGKMVDEIPTGSLDQYTVLAFLNVADPGVPLARATRAFVNQGGGVFLSVGDRVDAALWNQRFAELLPQPLGLTRTAAALPGQSAGETEDNRPAERLLPLDRRHPILSAFPEGAPSLTSARFFRYLLLDPVRDNSQLTVVLRYESGAPALVEKDVGKGRVLLLTTTVDREWTDLPIRPGFLPLAREMMRRLVGDTAPTEKSTLLAGEARHLILPGDASGLEVIRPDGTAWVAERATADTSRIIAFTNTEQLGRYQVRVPGGQDGATGASQNFVVNPDPRESNPARLAPDRRPDRVARSASTAAPPKHRVEWWHLLAALIPCALLAESILTLRWRGTFRQRNGTDG